MAELAGQIGWSRTRLTQAFRRHVGGHAEAFARILRFRRALELVQQAEAPLSRVAMDAGYYDQPHFNADFREMSGVTPPGLPGRPDISRRAPIWRRSRRSERLPPVGGSQGRRNSATGRPS